MAYRRPEPLSERHQIKQFRCGEEALDAWLCDMALYNQVQQYTRTFVIADAAYNVVGYHSLCAGMIHRNDVSRSVKGGQAPNEIPVALLARLAVDSSHQGRGLGPALLRNALQAAVSAGQAVAFRAVMVDALNVRAIGFYTKFGFRPSKISPSKLLLPMKDVLSSLEKASEA